MARAATVLSQEIARELGLNYAFAPVYTPCKKQRCRIGGRRRNTASIRPGDVLKMADAECSRRALAKRQGQDVGQGKTPRRLRALIADIEHPAGMLRAVTVHLDAHCSRAHRKQMEIILDHLATLPEMPTLIGGWNTTTFNSQSSTRVIMGYWRRYGAKERRKSSAASRTLFRTPALRHARKRGYDFRR